MPAVPGRKAVSPDQPAGTVAVELGRGPSLGRREEDKSSVAGVAIAIAIGVVAGKIEKGRECECEGEGCRRGSRRLRCRVLAGCRRWIGGGAVLVVLLRSKGRM